jgi:hypothetical protein
MSDTKQDWRTKKFWGRPWQDLVFSVAEVVFLVALVPMLFNPAVHVTLLAGAATGLMLYVLMLCQISYANWIASFMTFVTATVWVILGFGGFA